MCVGLSEKWGHPGVFQNVFVGEGRRRGRALLVAIFQDLAKPPFMQKEIGGLSAIVCHVISPPPVTLSHCEGYSVHLIFKKGKRQIRERSGCCIGEQEMDHMTSLCYLTPKPPHFYHGLALPYIR